MTRSARSGRASARPLARSVPAVPAPPQRGPTAKALKTFLYYLGRSGSVSFAAARSGIERMTLYRRRARDEQFARHWDEALNLGIDRLQDNAMQRALDGTERPVWRNGKQVGSVQQYDNRLLQFLLRSHRPETYGDRKQSAVPPLSFDLAKRLAASAPRLEAHLAERRAEESKERERQQDQRPEKKNGKGQK